MLLMLLCCQHRGPEKPASYHSKIDAEIDSLTSMLADLDSHPQDSSTQVGPYTLLKLNVCLRNCMCSFANFRTPRSCTTTCLITSTSQGITTNLRTRAHPLLRVGHPWATPLIPRANTTQRRPTPTSTSHLSTPPPTSRTTTPRQLLSPTLSPSRPPTPLPQLPPGPGSASRSRRRSLSPTLRRGGRLSRRTHHPLHASTFHAPLPRVRQVNRAGTLHIPTHRLRRCTLRRCTKGAAQDLEEESTRFHCPREGWKIIRRCQELHRVLLTSPARYGRISTSLRSKIKEYFTSQITVCISVTQPVLS